MLHGNGIEETIVAIMIGSYCSMVGSRLVPTTPKKTIPLIQKRMMCVASVWVQQAVHRGFAKWRSDNGSLNDSFLWYAWKRDWDDAGRSNSWNDMRLELFEETLTNGPQLGLFRELLSENMKNAKHKRGQVLCEPLPWSCRGGSQLPLKTK